MTKIQPTFFAITASVLVAGALTFNQPAHAENGATATRAVGTSNRVVAEKLHPTANLSYKVAGRRYYPQKNVQDFSQTGRASWYGPGFHGRRTSNGERFDMNELTAAHPTLPIPSYARVTNLKNGRSIVVRINDRGPFHGNRVMDVSRAAAEKLGFLHAGTAQVHVEQLKAGDAIDDAVKAPVQSARNDKNSDTNRSNNRIFVSLKTFDNKSDAQSFVRVATRHLNRAKAEQRAIMVKRGNDYVVRVGPFSEQKHATETQNRLKQVSI